MNSPEKIAGMYLRLNGFFLLPQFTLFDGDHHTHVDFLALRAPGSIESCRRLKFETDDSLFNHIDSQLELENSRKRLLALVVEVKGNKKKQKPGNGHYDYIDRFIGNAKRIKIHFRDHGQNTSISNDVIEVPLRYALRWIIDRIDWIDDNQEGLAKHSSWTWSESSLSDIIYLKRLGFLN
jgi:hypothetical protein